jgi:uncharacterized membrane protein YkvA (DUF1232 family)
MDNLTSKELQPYGRHYNEEDFWKKLRRIASKVGVKVVYYALVLYYTMVDESVPMKYKAIIAGALGYMILPMDLIPDFLPFAGLADDWAALLAAVTYVSGSITATVKGRAKEKVREWFPSVTEADYGDLK